MMFRALAMLVAALAAALVPTLARAHSGGTDSFGCHVDSSTGIRHCHDEGDGEISTGAVLMLGAVGATALAGSGIGMYFRDRSTFWAGLSIVGVVLSEVNVAVATRHLSRAGAIASHVVFGALNATALVVDVMIFARVFAPGPEPPPPYGVDLSGGVVAIGVPRVTIHADGVYVANLAGLSF